MLNHGHWSCTLTIHVCVLTIGPGLYDEDGEEPMEAGYKAALVRFQLDQIKVTKEYQKLLGEKDAEVSK